MKIINKQKKYNINHYTTYGFNEVSVNSSYFLILFDNTSSLLIKNTVINNIIDINNYDTNTHAFKSPEVIKIIDNINNVIPAPNIDTNIIKLNVPVLPGKFDYFNKLIIIEVIINTISIIDIG